MVISGNHGLSRRNHMDNVTICQAVRRTEDLRFLTGAGRYIEDIGLRHMAHGLVLRSPHAHARIDLVDAAAAERLPGVLAVLTGADWAAEGLGDIPTRTQAKAADGGPVWTPPRHACPSGAGAGRRRTLPGAQGDRGGQYRRLCGLGRPVYTGRRHRQDPGRHVPDSGAVFPFPGRLHQHRAGRALSRRRPSEAAFQIERIVDLAARELGIDPVDLRRRNLIPAADMPYRTGTGLEIESGDFETVLDRTLELADWDGFPRRAAATARGWRRGIGVAMYLGVTGGRREECADLRFDADGNVTVAVGAESPGTGHETTFPQIVADRLGIPLARIRHRQADTDATPVGSGHGGSHGLEVAGSVVSMAADKVIDQAKPIAGQLLEAAVDDIDFADGRFTITGTDRSVSMSEVIAAAGAGLDAAVTHAIQDITFPNGCHVAEVEVDPETGRVRLVGYAGVHDFGSIMIPMIAEGQAVGATAQGIGQALLEELVYDPDDGQLLSGSLMDYGLPRADDLPAFRTATYEGAPSRTNPLGVKGAGEAGCGGAPPAIVGAVVDALKEFGVRHIDMPLTPMRVWRAIEEAREEAPAGAESR